MGSAAALTARPGSSASDVEVKEGGVSAHAVTTGYWPASRGAGATLILCALLTLILGAPLSSPALVWVGSLLCRRRGRRWARGGHSSSPVTSCLCPDRLRAAAIGTLALSFLQLPLQIIILWTLLDSGAGRLRDVLLLGLAAGVAAGGLHAAAALVVLAAQPSVPAAKTHHMMTCAHCGSASLKCGAEVAAASTPTVSPWRRLFGSGARSSRHQPHPRNGMASTVLHSIQHNWLPRSWESPTAGEAFASTTSTGSSGGGSSSSGSGGNRSGGALEAPQVMPVHMLAQSQEHTTHRNVSVCVSPGEGLAPLGSGTAMLTPRSAASPAALVGGGSHGPTLSAHNLPARRLAGIPESSGASIASSSSSSPASSEGGGRATTSAAAALSPGLRGTKGKATAVHTHASAVMNANASPRVAAASALAVTRRNGSGAVASAAGTRTPPRSRHYTGDEDSGYGARYEQPGYVTGQLYGGANALSGPPLSSKAAEPVPQVPIPRRGSSASSASSRGVGGPVGGAARIPIQHHSHAGSGSSVGGSSVVDHGSPTGGGQGSDHGVGGLVSSAGARPPRPVPTVTPAAVASRERPRGALRPWAAAARAKLLHHHHHHAASSEGLGGAGVGDDGAGATTTHAHSQSAPGLGFAGSGGRAYGRMSEAWGEEEGAGSGSDATCVDNGTAAV